MAPPRGTETILDSIPTRPEGLRFLSRNGSPAPRTAPTNKTLFDSPIALEFDQLCLQREARRRRRRSAPVFLLRQEDVGGVERTRPQTARADLRAAETDRPGVESEGESEGSSDDEDSDESDAEESGRADIVRGRTRTRHNGTRPQRPERKSLDEGMLDFLHKVREKGQRGRYTAVRTLLAPVKPLRGASRAEGEGEGGGHDSQGTRRREKTDMEAEPVEEGITEPAERRGSVRSVGGEDNDSSVDSRIERNLRTAVKRSELLVEGFADVVKQIEAAEIGEEKKEELMEEVLDRMPPEGPFELP